MGGLFYKMSLRVSMLDSSSDIDEEEENFYSPQKTVYKSKSPKSSKFSPNFSKFSGENDYSDNGSKHSLAEIKELEKSYFKIQKELEEEQKNLKERKQKAQTIIRMHAADANDYDEQAINKIIADTKKAEDFIENNPLNFLEIELKSAQREVSILEKSNSEKRSKLKLTNSSGNSDFSSQTVTEIPKLSFDDVEKMFAETKRENKVKDADKKISEVCEIVQKRNSELKEERRRVKKLEEDNQKVRDEMEQKYSQQQKKLKQLEAILESQKKLGTDVETMRETIVGKRNELNILERQKEQLERQNYTVTRDKIYNKNFKKVIDDLQNQIRKKKETIELNKRILETQKENVRNLEEQVKNKEKMLEKYENKIIKMEAEVKNNGTEFSNTIEEAKREIDSLGSLRNSASRHSSINDEIADLFNDKSSERIDFTPKSKKSAAIPSDDDEMESSDLDSDYFEPSRVSARLSLHSPSPLKTADNTFSPKYQTEMSPTELSQLSPMKSPLKATDKSSPARSPYMEELVNLFS